MTAWFRNTFKWAALKNSWRGLLAVLMLLLAIVFFRSERKELSAIIPHIQQANPFWLLLAVFITVITYFFQAGMYRQSFAAISFPLHWWRSIELYLKRNFLGVFLPAGTVSALAYSPPQIRKAGFTKLQINQASGLFGFAGLVSVFIAGLPVIIYTFLSKGQFRNSWMGLLIVLLIITILFVAVRSFRQKSILYKWVDNRFPSVSSTVFELLSAEVNGKHFNGAVLYSIGVELCGMFQIYVAMLALGLPASFVAAASTYILSVLIIIISPFLRGLGAVELTMVYVLEQFGYSSSQALSVTILYRVVEFWLPLLTGLLAFAWNGKNVFLRIAPVILTFLLGLMNIISAVTPPLHHRLRLLHEYIPFAAIHASHLLVLLTGLLLLVISAFLFRGLRNAWIIALMLSILSLIGHLGKALDYEEAFAAAFTIIVLLATVSQYRIRSSNKWMKAGVKIAMLNFAAVLLFGFISFYFIDVKHFGVDFTWQQSLIHTLKVFLLAEDNTLNPVTRFGHEFIWLIRCLGFITWGFLLFTLIKPGLRKQTVIENYNEKAAFLLRQFGNSSNDYFKTYKDKLFFFSDIHDAFLAYRIAGGFAIVLEEPVCAEENKLDVLSEFDRHCRKMGLKPAFYRVDENSIPWFNNLRKKKLIIGQEAILELKDFTMEGKDKKSLRNGMNSFSNKGYTTAIHTAPHTGAFLSQLKSVSDEWLYSFQKEEFVFSQGMFDQTELQQQDIITVEDAEGNIKAFLNIIPDYAADESTYDLIRKTNDAPGAAMDALIIKLIEYAKAKNKLYLNLGMVPMTGISQPDNTAEQIIKLAAEKIKRFQHYKGLREFKEKYATMWENKYLIYDNDFDLLQLPSVLNNVMKA
jgi:phosphatidylglycerol lysyltransferase